MSARLIAQRAASDGDEQGYTLGPRFTSRSSNRYTQSASPTSSDNRTQAEPN